MMILNSNEYKIHFQSIRNVHIKLDILNNQELIVYQLQTEAIDGNISLDGQNPSRRICDLQLVYKPRLMPAKDSPIWLNKRIRIHIGIKSLLNDVIYYFDYGIFAMAKVDINISSSENVLNINCLDKMAFLDGTMGGQINSKELEKLVIEPNTPIHEAIKYVVKTHGFETKLLIDTHESSTSYKIEKKPGDTVWSVLEELSGLHFDWQCYYDKNGYFNFNKRKNKLFDPIVWSTKGNKDLRLSHSSNINFDNIRNSFTIHGMLSDSGLQTKVYYEITKNTEPNSPFTVEDIGMRTFFEKKDKYDLKNCEEYLNFKKFKHTNFNEQITFTCVPLYFLDIGDVIEYNLPNTDVYEKYVIDKIECSLKYDVPMSITAYKIY